MLAKFLFSARIYLASEIPSREEKYEPRIEIRQHRRLVLFSHRKEAFRLGSEVLLSAFPLPVQSVICVSHSVYLCPTAGPVGRTPLSVNVTLSNPT